MKTLIEAYCEKVASDKDRELTISLETQLDSVQVDIITKTAESYGVRAYFSNWSVLIKHPVRSDTERNMWTEVAECNGGSI